MMPSCNLSGDAVVAVTAARCRLAPMATVAREACMTLAPRSSSTVIFTVAPMRSASQTVTDVGVTLRSMGPARTRGLLPSEFRSDVQGMGYLLKQSGYV